MFLRIRRLLEFPRSLSDALKPNSHLWKWIRASPTSRPSRTQSGEEICRKVSFSRIRKHGKHALSTAKFLGSRRCSMHDRSRRNTAKNSFEFCKPPGCRTCLFVAHRNDSVDDLAIEYLWHEAGADTLNSVGARLSAGKERRFGRFHRVKFELRNF